MKNKLKFILIHGAKGSGKSSVADSIVNLMPSFKQTSLAAPLKVLLELEMGVDPRMLWGPSENRSKQVHLDKQALARRTWDDCYQDVDHSRIPVMLCQFKYTGATLRDEDVFLIVGAQGRTRDKLREQVLTVREALTTLGDLLRSFYGVTWSAGHALIYQNVHQCCVVVPDIRYKDELKFITEAYGRDACLCVKLIRDSVEFENEHPSERGLPDELFDAVVENNGSSPRIAAETILGVASAKGLLC